MQSASAWDLKFSSNKKSYSEVSTTLQLGKIWFQIRKLMAIQNGENLYTKLSN